MTTLESVEKAVTQLSHNELAKFRQWFDEYDGELWDAQIESDARAGKLDWLAAEALADYRTGKATEI